MKQLHANTYGHRMRINRRQYGTFAGTLDTSCRTQLLHCIKQVARADLFETNVIMDTDLIVESSIEQTRNIASLLVHRKCTCIDQKHTKA